MNIERPGSPSATTVAPTSKRRSTSIETRRSRLASERPPKKGVASKNAFRSGELTAIDLIYSRSQRRQAGQTRRAGSSNRRSNHPRRLQLLDLVRSISQRSQNLVIMLAEVGRGGSNFSITTRDLAGLRHQIDLAEPRMRDRSLDAQLLHLRIGEGIPDVVDRPAGKARFHQQFEPFAGGPRA